MSSLSEVKARPICWLPGELSCNTNEMLCKPVYFQREGTPLLECDGRTLPGCITRVCQWVRRVSAR